MWEESCFRDAKYPVPPPTARRLDLGILIFLMSAGQEALLSEDPAPELLLGHG